MRGSTLRRKLNALKEARLSPFLPTRRAPPARAAPALVRDGRLRLVHGLAPRLLYGHDARPPSGVRPCARPSPVACRRSCRRKARAERRKEKTRVKRGRGGGERSALLLGVALTPSALVRRGGGDGALAEERGLKPRRRPTADDRRRMGGWADGRTRGGGRGDAAERARARAHARAWLDKRGDRRGGTRARARAQRRRPNPSVATADRCRRR